MKKSSQTGDTDNDRNMRSAIAHGLHGRCPACGQGKLFNGFLQIVPHCSVCGEALHHHRADDLPPYIVITIVGHIIVTLILIVETFFDVGVVAQMIMWPLLTLVLSLVLMRPVKGGVIGYQWALRMHGFSGNTEDAATGHS